MSDDPRIEAVARALCRHAASMKMVNPTITGTELIMSGKDGDLCRMQASIAVNVADSVTWRPMEEAPKDGTEILGYSAGRRVVIWWQEEDRFTPGFWADGVQRLKNPRMWQPLPNLPEEHYS